MNFIDKYKACLAVENGISAQNLIIAKMLSLCWPTFLALSMRAIFYILFSITNANDAVLAAF